jgi:hypothetical protein
MNRYYINNRNLWEVDLLIEKNLKILPVEIKLSATIGPSHLKNFEKLRMLVDTSDSSYLICNTSAAKKRKNPLINSWSNL